MSTPIVEGIDLNNNQNKEKLNTNHSNQNAITNK